MCVCGFVGANPAQLLAIGECSGRFSTTEDDCECSGAPCVSSDTNHQDLCSASQQASFFPGRPMVCACVCACLSACVCVCMFVCLCVCVCVRARLASRNNCASLHLFRFHRIDVFIPKTQLIGGFSIYNAPPPIRSGGTTSLDIAVKHSSYPPTAWMHGVSWNRPLPNRSPCTTLFTPLPSPSLLHVVAVPRGGRVSYSGWRGCSFGCSQANRTCLACCRWNWHHVRLQQRERVCVCVRVCERLYVSEWVCE